MQEKEITKINDIFDENNLSCFSLNNETGTIIVSDYINDELLYNEMEELTKQLDNNGFKFTSEGNYLYLSV